MTPRKNSRDLIAPGAIVGTVHSKDSLRAALRAAPGTVDLMELRVDHFADEPATLLATTPRLKAPLIVTVRHPSEGGQGALGFPRRRELYAQFLPVAAAIDIELRSAARLADVIKDAHGRGVRVIISFHDFRSTPSAARLRSVVVRGEKAGADVVKIAARADSPQAVHRLLGVFAAPSRVPVSVMGMGSLGKVSRLLFAQAGSVLNYAYFGSANASGQWSAREFRERLAEIRA